MNILPVIQSVNSPQSSGALFENLKNQPYSFMLDTCLPIKGLGQFTFLGADPFLVVRSKNGITEICDRIASPGDQQQVKQVTGDPLQVLKNLMRRYQTTAPDIPFGGGAVGFFSYDFGRQLEKIPQIAEDDLQMPDFIFGFYDLVIAIDNNSNEIKIISTGLPAQGKQALKRAGERVEWLENMITLKHNQVQFADHPGDYIAKIEDIKANFTKAGYQNAVSQAIEHILCGDIFQVNLSQRFEMAAKIESWQLFKKLKEINPAPFSAYLNFDAWQIICSSMERFLGLGSNGAVQTCPIKGTRPRGSSESTDLANYRALKNSLKDQAELTMIVDLARNDLGKLCTIGSVKVADCFRIETYPTVYHLVATIKGQLPSDKDVFDLIRAAFPGGSITGAPKIKAMEIIERLEPVRRGIYTGSLGYIGFDGRADLNIVIRTIVRKNNKYYFQVGGGLTADSNPAAEYYETLDKAKALMQALGLRG